MLLKKHRMNHKIYFLILFVISQSVYSTKIKYTPSIIINGKLTTTNFLMVESFIDNLPKTKKINYKKYIVTRSDIPDLDTFFSYHKPDYFKDNIYNLGDEKETTQKDLTDEIVLIKSKYYSLYDKVFVVTKAEDLSSQTSEINKYFNSINNLNRRKLRDIKILIILNVKNIKKDEIREIVNTCPSSVHVKKGTDNISLCNRYGEVGYIFKWTTSPANLGEKFIVTFFDDDTQQEYTQDTISYADCVNLKMNNFQYFISTTDFQKHFVKKSQTKNIYSINFKWKVVCICVGKNAKYFPSETSEVFNFGKCPDAKDNPPNCDE